MLTDVQRVRVAARAADGFRFTGEGDVVASTGPDGSILLAGSGSWSEGRVRPVRFSSAFLWRFEGATVRLSHTRRGSAHEVALVDLVHSGGDRWTSAAPHVCGADRYDAIVRIASGRIFVRWRVRGPHKLQLLRSTFSRGTA